MIDFDYDYEEEMEIARERENLLSNSINTFLDSVYLLSVFVIKIFLFAE